MGGLEMGKDVVPISLEVGSHAKSCIQTNGLDTETASGLWKRGAARPSFQRTESRVACTMWDSTPFFIQ
jgi:hypothetical protein